MEYVPGRTLRDLLNERGRLSAAEALELLEPVLAALAAAHAAGIVHRDVKPENVLLADDGRVKVADFGLARAFSGAAGSATRTQGVILGTMAYLSPEQVEHGRRTRAPTSTPSASMLYELLTGTLPFTGDSPINVAFRHVNEDVPPPSRLVPSIHPAVDALVERATDASPRNGRRTPAGCCRRCARSDARCPRRPRSGRCTVGGPADDRPHPPAGQPSHDRRAGAEHPAQGTRRGRRPQRHPTGRPTTSPLVAGPDRAAAARRARGRGRVRRLVGDDGPVGTHSVGAQPRPRRCGRQAHQRTPQGVVRSGRLQRDLCQGRGLVDGPGRRRPAAQGRDGDARGVQGAGAVRGAQARRHRPCPRRAQPSARSTCRSGSRPRSTTPVIPSGQIISQSKPVGTPLAKGSSVDVVVSHGPEPIKVPDLRGGQVGDGDQPAEPRWA